MSNWLTQTSLSELKSGVKLWDLNTDGKIDFFEFRAWWAVAGSAAKDADAVIALSRGVGMTGSISSGRPPGTDDSMIMIGTMRLYDMIKWVHALHGWVAPA